MSESFVISTIGIVVALFVYAALDAYFNSRMEAQAAPLCAAHAAYPVGVSGRLVICEGADATGARVWTVVEVSGG